MSVAAGGSRHQSTRKRHMSMQDRVEMYNTVMALEDEDSSGVGTSMEDKPVATAAPRVRKTSKVMFEPPPEIEVGSVEDGKESVTAEVHQVGVQYGKV